MMSETTTDYDYTLRLTDPQSQIIKDSLRHERGRIFYNMKDRVEYGRPLSDLSDLEKAGERDWRERQREKMRLIDEALELIAEARGGIFDNGMRDEEDEFLLE